LIVRQVLTRQTVPPNWPTASKQHWIECFSPSNHRKQRWQNQLQRTGWIRTGNNQTPDTARLENLCEYRFSFEASGIPCRLDAISDHLGCGGALSLRGDGNGFTERLVDSQRTGPHKLKITPAQVIFLGEAPICKAISAAK
jgi:hypothetical protein